MSCTKKPLLPLPNTTPVTRLDNLSSIISTQVAAILGINNVYEGKTRWTDKDETFEKQVREASAQTTGWFNYWIAARSARSQTETGTVVIHGVVTIHLPNTSTNARAMYNLLENTLNALLWEQAYISSSCRPLEGGYTEHIKGENLAKYDEVIQYDYTITYLIAATAGTEIG